MLNPEAPLFMGSSNRVSHLMPISPGLDLILRRYLIPFRSLLQEIAKLLDGQPGIPNDTAEGKGVNRVMTWDRQDARAI